MAKVDFDKLKILIVEDHEPTSRTIASILSAGGVGRVVCVSDVIAAVGELRGTLFDLMLCDIGLGQIDGLALVKAVRHNAKLTNRYMAIVMLTGDSREATVAAARGLGVNRFLSKPVEPETLLRTIREVLEHPRAFVETKEYSGPDRRVRDEPSMKDRRRSDRATKKPGFGDPWE